MSEVAVVVPCHDLGRTLREALDSVRAQTRPAGELVVVDDGSEDLYTRQELAAVEREGIPVVRTANHGLAAVRNLGVRITSSPYVVLLDADDLLAPTYIERLAGLLDARPEVDFVTCDLETFGRASYRWSPPPCTVVQLLAQQGGLHASSMFRRRVWEAAGGFVEGLAGYEDFDFWLSAVEAGCRGEVIAEPLFRYRIRDGSMFHRVLERRTFVETMAAIYPRHRASIERHAEELLMARDRLLQDQRANYEHLARRRQELEDRLAAVEERITAARARLAERGLGPLDWGDFDRLEPLSPVWGLDRGRPLDRRYIEGFLASHRDDIRGRVLEIKDAGYSRWLGGERVTRSDVLDRDRSNPHATLVGDLGDPGVVPSDHYDCFLFTQALQFNLDVRATLANAVRVLRPGGVLLCTVPAVSRLDYEEGGRDGKDAWRFSESALRRLFAELVAPEDFEVTVYGNVKAAAAFLWGVSPDEMKPEELDAVDPWFPVTYGVRLVKPAAPPADRRAAGERLRGRARAGQPPTGAVLMYHRVADHALDPHRLAVPPEQFRAEMERLATRFRPMPLEELVAAARANELPPGAVAVTFDDGCLDNLVNASPILAATGVPATFFVTSGALGGGEHPWDLLPRIFLAGGAIPERLELPGRDGAALPTRTDEERAEAHRQVDAILYALDAPARRALLASLAAWSGLDLAPRSSHRTMTAEEVRDLASRPGHAIGGHTTSHLALDLQPAATQQREIAEDRAALERLLGRPVTSFAYPYGAHSRETIRLAGEAGYRVAVTVEPRVVRAGLLPLQVPRLEVRRGPIASFDSLLAEVAASARVRA